MAKLIVDGYGQLELNQVAWPRDGRIEAQCALDANDFNTGAEVGKPFCENGMILVVDNVTRTIRRPKTDDENVIYAINYSAEHLYDERAQGLKNFKLNAQPNGSVKTGAGRVNAVWAGYDFFPRLGYMSTGDKFTTNAVELGAYADIDAVATAMKTGKVYAGAGTTGYITLGDDAFKNGPVLEVIKVTTMPDGQPALKFQVVKA